MPILYQQLQRGFQNWKRQFRKQYGKLKSLQGDPHYIAVGIAVGVFVAFTPTIPFHTIFALSLAFIFKGSKPAALIGSWLSNPLTVPVLYYGSFRIGHLLFGSACLTNIKPGEIQTLMSSGWHVALAMVTGGALLGIVPAVIVYFSAFHLFRKFRSHRKPRLCSAPLAAGNCVFGHHPVSKK